MKKRTLKTSAVLALALGLLLSAMGTASAAAKTRCLTIRAPKNKAVY